MAAGATKRKKLNANKALEERDFMSEYSEFLKVLELKLENLEFEKDENTGHIRKFSLMKKTPTLELSGNTRF